MQTKQRKPGVGLLVAILAGAGLAGGCQSVDPAVQRSQQATDVMVQSRQSLGSGEQTVAESQTALRTLSESKGDLRPQFAVFAAQLDAVRKEADQLKRESDLVQSQSTIYCSARQNDVATISNVDMRRAAEMRAARMREQCNTVKEMYAQVNGSFEAYIRNLNDLQTFLASELNYAALDSGRRWVDEALASGDTLRHQIRGLALQVELTSNTLSPVPIAATQWPSNLPPGDALADQH